MQTCRLTGTGADDMQPAVVKVRRDGVKEAGRDDLEREMLLLPHWMGTRRGLGRLSSHILRRSSVGSLAKEC